MFHFKKMAILFGYCSVVFLTIFAPTRSEVIKPYPYYMPIDTKMQLSLKWDVNYETKMVDFQISANLPEFVTFGLGFSDYGEITNADMVLFTKDDNNHYNLQDCWTDDKGVLHVDSSQDYGQTMTDTTGAIVTVEFKRRFDTCDDHDYVLDNGTTHVIYFSTDDTNTDVVHTDISGTRHGFQRVQILKLVVPDVSFPEDTWTFDITNPNITVPAEVTTYWWYRTHLPPLPTKTHVIKYEPLIQPGNEFLVHHIEVYHCEVKPGVFVQHFNGRVVDQFAYPSLLPCKRGIGTWAVGAQSFVMPEEAGTPIGGPGQSSYLLMEVHYNNDAKTAGIKDSTGMRFHVTTQLRKYDAGILELGLEFVNKMVIPPGQPFFPLTGYCTPECTQKGLPSGGMKIFASQLHTHYTGKKIYTKHVRNGKELPEMNRDDHYSPKYQEIRRLVPFDLLPGDALITTCEFDSVDRDHVTVGGFGLTDEMCVNYVFYYPWSNLEVCKSSVSTNALYGFFQLLNDMKAAHTSPEKGLKDNFNTVSWSNGVVSLLDNFYKAAPISMQCNQSDGSRFPGDWSATEKPHITIPLETQDPCENTET